MFDFFGRRRRRLVAEALMGGPSPETMVQILRREDLIWKLPLADDWADAWLQDRFPTASPKSRAEALVKVKAIRRDETQAWMQKAQEEVGRAVTEARKMAANLQADLDRFIARVHKFRIGR